MSYFNPLSENFILLRLWEFLTNIFSALGTLLSYFNPFSDNFIFTNFFATIGNILSYVNPFSDNFFAYKLIDLLNTALHSLFVPSEERITAIKNTVTTKFDFIESIKISIDSIKNIFNNLGNAPKLEISVGETNYTDSQKVTVIDFAFYQPFKPYGDLIITGFAYFFFIWRIFINLPNIIHGLGGSVDSYQMLGDIEAHEKTGFGRSSMFGFRRGGGRR